jgi:hypothetical protein
VGTDGAERDRRITDELTRFLIRDNPDARVVVDHVAAPKDAAGPRDPTHRKAERKTDLLLACLIVVVAVGLLHVATRWGETDPISGLVYVIASGDWTAAALSATVLLICGLLLIPLPYVLLRSIRRRG